MALTDQLNGQINDLDAQIKRIQERSQAEIAALEAKKAALQSIGRVITPDLEVAVATLQKFGLVTFS